MTEVFDGGNDTVLVGSNSTNSTDANFFVSGSIGSRGTAARGTAVFGGDLVVSGTLSTIQKHICTAKYTAENANRECRRIIRKAKKNSPNAFVICITNPLDVMVMALQKFSGLPANKVVGMAGILDSSRYKLFLSLELNVPVKDIEAMVMGGHGDTMVPLPRLTKISGKPLLDLVKEGKISSEKLESINQRTRDGGAEIVKYLEKGSAFYAPAASGVQMAEAYLQDKKLTLPCAVKLDGQYGFKDVYAGVPVIIGSKGVEKIVEIELNDQEKKEFIHSVDSVKKLWDAATKIDPDLK